MYVSRYVQLRKRTQSRIRDRVADFRICIFNSRGGFKSHVFLAVPSARIGHAVLVYGTLQAKFAASSILPLPLYFAICGYGHNGPVRSTFSSAPRWLAMS